MIDLGSNCAKAAEAETGGMLVFVVEVLQVTFLDDGLRV